MFLTIEELKSVLYEYQMDDIANGDDTVLEDAIDAAVSEVQSYLLAANQRRETATLTKQQYAAWALYDTEAIFATEGAERNQFLLRLTKRVAAWNVVELAAPDVLYERVKERYDAAVNTLEKVAGLGEYANSRPILPGLPTIEEDSEASEEKAKPIRMISKPKFNHEYYG